MFGAADAEPGFTFIVGNGVGMLLRKVAKAAADGRPGRPPGRCSARG